jgi:NAD(P)-dependent dehydrogenase (short-subunit alcohol dehydrogenase family)
MTKRLDGRVALVTGAGNGIGQACAMELARHGAAVVVNDLGTDEYGKGASSAAAEATVEAIRAEGGTAVANPDSVASSAGCEAALQAGIDAFGKVDIIVGVAGAMLNGSLTATDDAYQRFLDLFLSQKFWLARAALPAMRERGWGRLIFTTSHGATGLLGQPIFAAAMGGVISMMKAIAHENRGSGVTANCLAPGAATRLHAINRPMFEKLRADGLITDDEWDAYVNTPPAEYVGPIVAWLCTEQAADVSGHVWNANGGLVARWSSYGIERSVYRGDHRTNPPFTLEELDTLVPKVLLADR